MRVSVLVDVGSAFFSASRTLIGALAIGGAALAIGFWGCGFGVSGGDGRGGFQTGAMRGGRSSSRRMRGAEGQALGRCRVMRVFISTTRAALFTSLRRRVSNWARRQGERFGRAARRVHISQ